MRKLEGEQKETRVMKEKKGKRVKRIGRWEGKKVRKKVGR